MALTEQNYLDFLAALKTKGDSSIYGKAFFAFSAKVKEFLVAKLDEALKNEPNWATCQKQQSAKAIDAESIVLAIMALEEKEGISSPKAGLKIGMQLVDEQNANLYGTPICNQAKSTPGVNLIASALSCTAILTSAQILSQLNIPSVDKQQQYDLGATQTPAWQAARESEIKTGTLSIAQLDSRTAEVERLKTLTDADEELKTLLGATKIKTEVERFIAEVKSATPSCVPQVGGAIGGSTASSTTFPWGWVVGSVVGAGVIYFAYTKLKD